MKGHIFIIAHNGLGPFVHGPARHAEKGLFRVIAPAADQAQHLGDAAALHLMGGHHGKTSGQKDVTHARGGVGRPRLFLSLAGFFVIASQQKKHADLRTWRNRRTWRS